MRHKGDAKGRAILDDEKLKFFNAAIKNIIM